MAATPMKHLKGGHKPASVQPARTSSKPKGGGAPKSMQANTSVTKPGQGTRGTRKK